MGRRYGPTGVIEFARLGVALALAVPLASCGKSSVDPKYGVPASQRMVEPGEPVPKGGGSYRVGRPYQVAGRTYVPQEDTSYDAQGVASWYGVEFHGRKTANGEVFDMHSISAAHPTLPIPSYVRVTNLRNNRSIIVRVNDRGPYHENRVIDVSVRAAKMLDFHRFGVTRVRVQYVGRAALEGSDDDKLAATLRTNGSPAQGPPTVLASARPDRSFQREYFDSKPAVRAEPRPAADEPQIREVRRAPPAAHETIGRSAAVPVRPSIGEAPRAAAAETSFDARFAPAAGATIGSASREPVSAFAPRFEGVMTGRGIY